MFGNELIENITADILGAADSIDFIVDKESSSLHFLFGDLLKLSDQRLRQRVLFSGLPNDLIKATVNRLQLTNPTKSTQEEVGITIIVIDNSICYLLTDNDDPKSPLKTTQNEVVNNYVTYFNHLWRNSNEITLYEDLSDIAKTDNYSKIVIATEDVYNRLQYDLKQDPRIIHSLEAYQFENLVETLLKKQGYDTILTPRSKDGGKDILAQFKTPDGFNCLCLVECKKYSPDRPVGVQWIRALYGIVEQQNANLGMLVTPSRFTKGVYDFQNEIKNKISLKDFNDLKNWIKLIK
jgi:HJR/Mrr/RecB family endonuclease